MNRRGICFVFFVLTRRHKTNRLPSAWLTPARSRCRLAGWLAHWDVAHGHGHGGAATFAAAAAAVAANPGQQSRGTTATTTTTKGKSIYFEVECLR